MHCGQPFALLEPCGCPRDFCCPANDARCCRLGQDDHSVVQWACCCVPIVPPRPPECSLVGALLCCVGGVIGPYCPVSDHRDIKTTWLPDGIPPFNTLGIVLCCPLLTCAYCWGEKVGPGTNFDTEFDEAGNHGDIRYGGFFELRPSTWPGLGNCATRLWEHWRVVCCWRQLGCHRCCPANVERQHAAVRTSQSKTCSRAVPPRPENMYEQKTAAEQAALAAAKEKAREAAAEGKKKAIDAMTATHIRPGMSLTQRFELAPGETIDPRPLGGGAIGRLVSQTGAARVQQIQPPGALEISLRRNRRHHSPQCQSKFIAPAV